MALGVHRRYKGKISKKIVKSAEKAINVKTRQERKRKKLKDKNKNNNLKAGWVIGT